MFSLAVILLVSFVVFCAVDKVEVGGYSNPAQVPKIIAFGRDRNIIHVYLPWAAYLIHIKWMAR